MPAKGRKLYECGGCDAYHPQDWNDDCRDDANRIYDLSFDDEVISIEEQLKRDEEVIDVQGSVE